MRRLWLAVALVVGCPAACGESADSPSEVGGGSLEAGLETTVCQTTTCALVGAECGQSPDGCGGVLTCGACSAGFCGGAGPNRCGTTPCAPLTCAQAKADCGLLSDGCSSVLSCGVCTLPDTCGGSGVQNRCGHSAAGGSSGGAGTAGQGGAGSAGKGGAGTAGKGGGGGGAGEAGTAGSAGSAGGEAGKDGGVDVAEASVAVECTLLGYACGTWTGAEDAPISCGECQLPGTLCSYGAFPNDCNTKGSCVQCVSDFDCSTKRCSECECLPRLDNGLACDEGSDCVSGWCSPNKGNDPLDCASQSVCVECRFDSDCGTGRCESCKCGSLLNAGEVCNEDSDCQSADCVADHCE